MTDLHDERDTGVLIDTVCVGCALPLPVNDLGLCEKCFAEFDRDLIRARDWDYSATASMTAPDQREALRERIIRDYGADYELIVDPETTEKLKRKNKRSHSRATQRKREIAARVARDYGAEDVFQAARDFIREQDEEWVNFSRVAQYLYERFHNLKPKRLGQPGKKYKSLLKFLADCPGDFEVRADADKRGLYWIRLV